MPLYEFECRKCQKQFTYRQTLGQHDQHQRPKCPACGSRAVHQLVSSIHVHTSKKS